MTMTRAVTRFEAGGAGWWIATPTAGEVLSLIGTTPGLLAPDAATPASWLAPLLNGCEGIETADGLTVDPSSWPVWQRVTLIDGALSWGAQHALAGAVVARHALTRDAAATLRHACEVFVDGGCECPVCAGEDIKRRIPCRYTARERSLLHAAVALGSQLEAPSLDGPWWVWQTSSIWRAARAQATTRERKLKEERDRFRETLAGFPVI